MAKKIRALLVGINDYSPSVGKLTGCVNDVERFKHYLTTNFKPNALQIETLTDDQATRANIIELFESHLCKATADDVVIFQYCGHGAQCESAKPFDEFYPDGKDTGLVCFDSRNTGGFDLADKELAVLLAKVARNDPHIAVIFDSCHSGSATRSADDFSQLRARQTHERTGERPLETYLDGHYAALLNRGESLQIPGSRHVLLAACESFQKARENTVTRSGVFTSTLLEVLEQQREAISYADLFMRCRATVRKRADDQDPQFETYGSFNAFDGFLGSQASRISRHHKVYFDQGSKAWQVDCGAVVGGLPSDPDKIVELALYAGDDRSAAVGHAKTTQVGTAKSELELLDFAEADTATEYQGVITSLPVPPMLVYLEGDADGAKAFEQFYAASKAHSMGFALLTEATDGAKAKEGVHYTLSAEKYHSDGKDTYLLRHSGTGKVIQGAEGYTQDSAKYMFSILKRVADWERMLKLQNHSTKMNPDDVRFRLFEVLDGKEKELPGDQITFDIVKENDEWKPVKTKFKANNNNRSRQALHYLLLHFSESYGYTTHYNERHEATESDFSIPVIAGINPIEYTTEPDFFLDEGDEHESIFRFKLIVSTEKIDAFELFQDGIKLGKIFRGGTSRSGFGKSMRRRLHKNDWFSKDLQIKLVPQLDRIGNTDAALAGAKITIKGHPSLQAGVSLTAVESGSRSVGAGSDIYRALQRQGMELLNFSSGTRGGSECILELTDIRNSAALANDPLEIELATELADDEFILPLAMDGEHILLTGEPSKDEQGRTHISINHIPEIPDNSRSLGSALKLYFFKTYLRRKNVNKLCWIEYKADGTFERHVDGVAEKVAAANNVVLLIHGIIGDTESMAQGMGMATDASGASLNSKFDVVLTYDYENLSTPIAETAVTLKQQLEAIGLHAQDDKRLTLMAHSMGGLVSRWFIEREAGKQVVDHLVMFGTPNGGSPFGKVESARKLSSVLTTLALNTFPAVAPFAGVFIYALNRSKKVTPTLEQMNPESDFIKTLNASDDPGVPYTIMAGDMRKFEEGSDDLFPKLIAKVGGGPLFDTLYQDAGHDIAVSDASIRGVDDSRTPPPRKEFVACHHLNYFVSESGLKAMGIVNW